MQIYILAVVAILLVILFVWLLLREQGGRTTVEQATEVKPVVAETRVAEPAAAPVVSESEPVPVVETKPAVTEPVEAEPAVVEPAEPEPAVTEPAAEPEAVEPPAPMAAAVPPVIDDLEIIEGIGPKIAAVLKQAGVTSFAQLAEMAPARIEEILHAANLRLADPHSWPEQARLAAAGDQAGLKALQDRLKGGREVSL